MRFIRSQVIAVVVVILTLTASSAARSIEDMKDPADRCICFRKPQEADALISLLEETTTIDNQVKRNSEMTGNLMQLSNLMKMLKYN